MLYIAGQHYFFVERTCGSDGEAIAAAMASGFGELFTFCQQHEVAEDHMPISIYMEMPAGA